MTPHAHVRSLPPKGAECRGSEPACAGSDDTKYCCVSQRCGLQDHASLEDGASGGIA
jgi:hypothetical protein